jgi:predicted ester cyclase
MAGEQYKAAIRDFFAAIDRDQSMAALDRLAAPDYVARFPSAPPMNAEGIKGYGNGFFAACPGLQHTVHDLVAEGDQVAVRLTIRGAQTREFYTPGGILPPSGRSFELPVLNLYRFANGKVVEHYSAFDMLSFLQQIGAMPGAEAPA